MKSYNGRVSFLRTKTDDGIIFVILLLITVAIGLYFGLGYQNLPSDDPAASVIGARYIVENQSVHFSNPLNPYSSQEFYSNLISIEFPIHTVLAQFFLLVGHENILTTVNHFMVPLFVFSGFGIYLLLFEVTKKKSISLFGVILVILSRWYGLTFWTGHYAQMLAYALLPLILVGMIRYHNQKQLRWLLMSIILTIAIFPIHSLSFLVASSSMLSYLLITVVVFRGSRRETLWILFAFLGVVFAAFMIVSYFSPTERYYPLFTPEDVSPGNVGSIVWTSINSILGLFLVIVGTVSELLRKRIAIIIWFLISYLFIHSGNLGIPFFQYRFAEFISLPLLVLAVVGFSRLVMVARGRVLRIATLSFAVIIFLPFQLQQQNNIRACHIQYCPGLNPVLILDDDRLAYEWIRDNTPKGSSIIGVPKFGLFIPAIALRGVLLPVKSKQSANDAYFALTEDSQELRWQHAVASGATYIVWDAVLERYGESYKTYKVFKENFSDQRYFQEVYDHNDVRIYRVQQ